MQTTNQSASDKKPTTLADMYDRGSKSWGLINTIQGNLAKTGTVLHAITATSMVLTGTIQFNKSASKPLGTAVHTAKWVKGKGNTFLSRMARSIDQQFRNPGLVMKGLKGFDHLATKLKMDGLGLGFNKANSFTQWTRSVIAGVHKGSNGMKTSSNPKMISKKIFPINVGLNVIDEGIKTVSKMKDGTLTKTDLPVSTSNVIIKSAAAGVGSLVVGTLGSALGPAGAAIGAYAGGAVGAIVGDSIAKIAEKGIRWVSGLFK